MTDTAAKKPDTLTFEAEVTNLLDLVIHSLYTNREIFLRELISNASDALDRLRFEALTNSDLLPEGEALCVTLERDEEAGTLTIADNGIGMDRAGLMANLGTLASSGTRRFLEQLREADSATKPELIGQFGVGFYSSFMVAKEVVVTTRKAGDDTGWVWRSTGGGEYSIEEAAAEAGETPRGTRITLHMKDGADEKSFLTEWKVREIVQRYSDFIEYPVQMDVTREEPQVDDDGKPVEGGEKKEVTTTETLNSMKPLWNRPKDEIKDEEYTEFYKHLTHDWTEPEEVIHFRAEGTFEYTALLFLPKERPFDMFDSTQPKSRLSLHVRKVMVMNDCEDLLPPWLRFIRGVVDSADLPLNISRDTLQDNPQMKKIGARLTKKVLEVLDKRRSSSPDAYAETWKAFGPILKEGIYMGDDEDNRISNLCLFQTTNGDEPTTLAEYVERMGEGQKDIWYLAGNERSVLESSPHLEAFKKKGWEVLLMLDPVDEWMLDRLREFDGKTLKNAAGGEGLEAEEEGEAISSLKEEGAPLLKGLGEHYGKSIKEVRFSSRLTDSPAVLVSAEGALSPSMQRMMRASGQEIPDQPRILEINITHPLVERMGDLREGDVDRFSDYADLLLGQALLSEGSPPPDPARFSRLVTELMVRAE